MVFRETMQEVQYWKRPVCHDVGPGRKQDVVVDRFPKDSAFEGLVGKDLQTLIVRGVDIQPVTPMLPQI